MGALLPTAIRAYAATWDTAGGDVGRVYAANTFGSIAGSLLSGFVLIPWIWTQQAFLVLVGINVLLAIGVGAAFHWGRALSAAAAIVVVALIGVGFSGGANDVLRNKALARIGAGQGSGAKLLYYGEDQVALVGLVEFRNGVRMIFTNGSLMTHWGLETFWMSHLPMAAAKDPRDVLVLCLGMGNTYVGATRHPADVTAVELSPQVVSAFHHLRSLQPVLPGNPVAGNGRIVVGDARNVVLVSREQFDVITVDPPPPLYSAGTSNFHTLEFYRLAKDRLRPGGVMCQWIPFRHCTVDEFRMLLRTYRAVFGNMQVWVPPSRMGAYLIGLRDDGGPPLDPDAVRQQLLHSPLIAADLRRITDEPVKTVLPIPIMTAAEVDRFCGDAPVMTDDHPYLEFPLFRNGDPSLQLMRMQDLVPFTRSNWISDLRK
jgi:spermidine synthase